jgi:hypothetical protein
MRGSIIEKTYPCGLDGDISATLTGAKWIPPLTLFQLSLLAIRIFRLGICSGEFRFGGPCPVDMVGLHILRIEMRKGTGDQIAPIALSSDSVLGSTNQDWDKTESGLGWTYTLCN